MDDIDVITTISLRRKTKDRIAELGKKGQSFDEILLMLIKKRSTSS